MASAGDIKAGRASVELTADNAGLVKILADSQARVSQYSQQVRQIDQRLRTVGDTNPQARAQLTRVRAGAAERTDTARQEADGRKALSQRLAAYKAEQAAARSAAAERKSLEDRQAKETQDRARQRVEEARAKAQQYRQAVTDQKAADQAAIAQARQAARSRRAAEGEAYTQQKQQRFAGVDQQAKQGRADLQERLAAYKAGKQLAGQEIAEASVTARQRVAIEKALWLATATAREVELAKVDQFYAKLRRKAAGNAELLAKTEESYAKRRSQVEQKYPGGGQAAGKPGLLQRGAKVFLGEGVGEKISQLAGGLGKIALLAAAIKGTQIAAQAASDASLYSMYRQTGQLDEQAKLSQKWLDTLGEIPLVGGVISTAFAGVSARNKEVIADFERMRALMEDSAKATKADRFEVETAGLTPEARQRKEIEQAYRERIAKAAELERLAGKYAKDSPEAAQAKKQAEQQRQVADQWKRVQEDKLERDRQLAAQEERNGTRRAEIAGIYDSDERRRAELAQRQAEELQQEQIRGDGNRQEIRRRHAIELANLEQELAGQTQEQVKAREDLSAQLMARLRQARQPETEGQDEWEGLRQRLAATKASEQELLVYKGLLEQVQAAEKGRKVDDLLKGYQARIEAARTENELVKERQALEKQLDQIGASNAQREQARARLAEAQAAERDKAVGEIRQDLQARLDASQPGNEMEKGWRDVEKRLTRAQASKDQVGQARGQYEQTYYAEFAANLRDQLRNVDNLKQEMDKLDQARGRGLIADDREYRQMAAALRRQYGRGGATSTFDASAAWGMGGRDSNQEIADSTRRTVQVLERMERRMGQGQPLAYGR